MLVFLKSAFICLPGLHTNGERQACTSVFLSCIVNNRYIDPTTCLADFCKNSLLNVLSEVSSSSKSRSVKRVIDKALSPIYFLYLLKVKINP